jgi:hypothetical protein
MQYKVWLKTSDNTLTPILQNISISVSVTRVDDKNTDTDDKASYFSLLQNCPNPFNPSTKIKFSVPQLSQIQIKVYDMLGKEIETLVNEEKAAGSYEMAWYADGLPSGVYFYRLQAGDFVETKKMILMK